MRLVAFCKRLPKFLDIVRKGMDSITEKFSVFDFFNLLIAGMVFGFMIAVGQCFSIEEALVKMAEEIEKSKFLLVIAISLVISCSLVLGAIFQVIGEKYGKNWKETKINNCLNKVSEKNDIQIIIEKLNERWENKYIKRFQDKLSKEKEIFGNCLRMTRLKEKACDYLKIEIPESFTPEQCNAFFVYCVYYLHIKGYDKKTEKLREVAGLSKLLSCAFTASLVINVGVWMEERINSHVEKTNLVFVVFVGVISIAMAVAFWVRYKLTTENRIKMVLSIYSTLCEMEKNDNKETFFKSSVITSANLQIAISKEDICISIPLESQKR